MTQIIFRIEAGRNLALLEVLRDEGVLADQFLKSAGAFPRGHGVSLNRFVGLLALRALFDERASFAGTEGTDATQGGGA